MSHIWMRHVSHMNASCHISYVYTYSYLWHMWIFLSAIMSHMHMSYHRSHINEPHHIWMSHVTAEWVMSHMYMSYHICDVAQYHILWRGTFVCDTLCDIVTSHISAIMSHMHMSYHISHLNVPCHKCTNHVTNKCCLTHVNESHHKWMSRVAFQWVRSHMNVSHHKWSHMNESCHIWMSHVTYECVTSQMSDHIWMSHVTYEWVMSHMNVWHHKCKSHVTHEWVSSQMNESHHIRMCHITHRIVPRHKWMSRFAYSRMKDSGLEKKIKHSKWNTANMISLHKSRGKWMSHVTYEWLMSRMNVSSHTYEWVHVTYHNRIWIFPVFPCACAGIALFYLASLEGANPPAPLFDDTDVRLSLGGGVFLCVCV